MRRSRLKRDVEVGKVLVIVIVFLSALCCRSRRSSSRARNEREIRGTVGGISLISFVDAGWRLSHSDPTRWRLIDPQSRSEGRKEVS